MKSRADRAIKEKARFATPQHVLARLGQVDRADPSRLEPGGPDQMRVLAAIRKRELRESRLAKTAMKDGFGAAARQAAWHSIGLVAP